MSRHKGIRTLMLDTLDKQTERDTRHRKDAARIAELERRAETLKAQLAEARKGLEAIREHHVFINDRAYRPISQSHTIALCDAALAASTPPPSTTTQGKKP